MKTTPQLLLQCFNYSIRVEYLKEVEPEKEMFGLEEILIPKYEEVEEILFNPQITEIPYKDTPIKEWWIMGIDEIRIVLDI